MIPIQDTIPSRKFPVANWSLIAINAFVFLLEMSLSEAQLQSLIYSLGLVPAQFTNPEWAAYQGLGINNYWPFLTNMFLHGGPGHFLGNMWTLYIFGDNVEDRMGTWKYIFFYLLCGFGASATHFFFQLNSTVPAIGASGAISGVMAAYMVLFPKSRIIFLFPIFFMPYFFELPAFFYIGIWFIGQFFSGTLSLVSGSGAGGIAFWAHIGGFIFGMILYKFFIKRRKYRKTFADEYLKHYQKYNTENKILYGWQKTNYN